MCMFDRVLITKGITIFICYFLFNFAISFIGAERTALDYLKVLRIYDYNTYSTYRVDLYKITGDAVFSSNHVYSGTVYPRIDYIVNSIKCVEIRGFLKFDFKVSLFINGNNTINCIIAVDCNRIVDARREDE